MTRARLRTAGLLALAPLVLAGGVAARVAGRVRASLHPAREAVGAPTGLAPVTPVRVVTADDVVIRGWYTPSRNRAAVILGHGWGGQRADLLPEARTLAAHGYGVLLFDWRAHGESGGARTTWGVDEQRDLDAVVRFVGARPDVDPSRIGALGFSMGGMTVADDAEHDPRLRAVAVEGAFTSLEDEMRHDEGRWGWWSGSVAVWTLRVAGIRVERERPVDSLCLISPRPLLVIAGTADRDLPVPVARRMYAAACQPKRLWVVSGATHGAYARRGGATFGQQLVSFFDRALPPPTTLAAAGGRPPGRP